MIHIKTDEDLSIKQQKKLAHRYNKCKKKHIPFVTNYDITVEIIDD
jgi:hypothetical protein